MTAAADERLVADGIRASIAAHETLLRPEQLSSIVAAASVVTAAFRAGGKLLVFGNGGSAADSQHIAGEFLGRYLLERAALPAISLPDNSAALTAIANDYEFADVFARQVRGLGAPGDVALAISTSGTSRNVLEGVAAAAHGGLRTIGLTGSTPDGLAERVEICVRVDANSTPRIQEGHMVVAHLICELVERACASTDG